MADQNLEALKKCVKDANGDAAKITACENTYKTATGATVDGGKVFLTPTGDATIVTDGGKVFQGKA